MNLVVDQGNSYFKIGLFNLNELVEYKRYAYHQQAEFDEWLKLQKIDYIIVSSVVNKNVTFDVISPLQTIYLDHSTPIPIQNCYHTPETLGHDRLANAVAAWSLNPHQNSLIIDGGTCIKYDLMTREGAYIGGVIAPGLTMRYKALHQFTDQLPLLTPIDLSHEFGIDSQTSMHTGVLLGINHEINGFIERYANKFDQLTIFMTGGDSKYFDKTDKKPIFAIQNLTLIGLNAILRYNVE